MGVAAGLPDLAGRWGVKSHDCATDPRDVVNGFVDAGSTLSQVSGMVADWIRCESSQPEALDGAFW